MATLEESLRARGASDQMINSRTFQMAQEVIADGAVDGLDEARLVEQRVECATARAQSAFSAINAATQESINLLNTMNEAIGDLERSVEEVTIKDKKTREAVNAYTLVLMRTKDAVGKDGMTERIWEKAIEAASYCAWRSIMGPKVPDQRDGSWNRIK